MESSQNDDLYVAILLYESSSQDPFIKPMFQECFVLIRAGSDEEARVRAEQHGKDQETFYHNVAGQEIRWTLRHVVDVNRALSDTMEDGAELYARHFTNYDAYHAFEPLLGGTID
ncbi:DUF4288 domain-containing protein [Sorangium sp. So ce1036]|uniref:DUF4288 domain-containing protein n=1 Tax=Sorangium sp. So ce1036 TaxID=3133328 RepID=UPI003F09C46C